MPTTTTVAVAYFGMTRSTRFVYESHHKKLFEVLRDNDIVFDAYIHSWKTDKNVVWFDDINIPNDYEEYTLLNPTGYQLDDQEEFLKTINMDDYFKKELYAQHGGDSPHEWHPQLIQNHICALESQKRVTEMCEKANVKYDYIIYIRPDVQIHDPFPVECLNSMKEDEIAILNKDHFEGYNDKFAVVPFQSCGRYGKRIEEMKEFRTSQGRITSEKCVKYIIDKYYKKVHFISFDFDIVRPHQK
jgi:hypothetical protein